MAIRLQVLPSSDVEFVQFARECWEALPEPHSPDALQAALRGRYPAAIVTPQQELARHGDGPLVWYAFRTAALARADEAADLEWPAWAILDDDRRFVEVSAALAEIVELPASTMVGHRIEDFSNPRDPTIRDDIERLWLEFKRTGTISSTVRFNYEDGRPRELGYRLDADLERPGRHRLSVKELSR